MQLDFPIVGSFPIESLPPLDATSTVQCLIQHMVCHHRLRGSCSNFCDLNPQETDFFSPVANFLCVFRKDENYAEFPTLKFNNYTRITGIVLAQRAFQWNGLN